MKKTKKFLSFVLAVLMLLSVVPMGVSGANAYTINGKTVRYTDFSSSPNDCWNYANNIYNKIWGQRFSNSFNDSNNSLRNLSDSQLLLNATNLKNYVSHAALGSCLRICNSDYLHGSDGWGHSQIIVKKDSNGFTVFEGGLTASPHNREKYYTWSEYCSTGWLGGTYKYIKYIKWPGASAYLSDTQKPSISNVKISNLSASGYTVTCNVSDNIGVTRVAFPTWTHANGQDDLFWRDGTISGNTATFTVKSSEHKNESGMYATHIYAYDAAGNSVSTGIDVTVPKPDTQKPSISNIKVTDIDSTGYTVTCNVSDNIGVTEVTFPTWTDYNHQDDIVWYKGAISGNTASVRIDVKNHNNEYGDYMTHIFVYDEAGNSCSGHTDFINVPKPDTEKPRITGITVTDVDSSGYTVTCSFTDNFGVTKVEFPTWTDYNHQDDLIWYQGDITGNTASVRIDVKNHNNEYGDYMTHIYVYDEAGNSCSGHTDFINVPKPDTQKPGIAHQHTYTSEITTQPTHLKEGVETFSCECGYSYTGTIAKKAHTYKSTTTKATLTKNGKTETKCSVCGSVKSTVTVYFPKTIKLSATKYTYNGKVQTPSVTVKDSKGKTLKKNTDYTVKYSKGRKSIGKYTVTVTFKGNYSGTKKLTFEIVPAKVTLSKLTAGSKALTATWKTISGVTGYEVQYSTSKKFTSKTTKTVKIKSSKTKKTTIKKLTKGKKYYVRIRAYKTVNKKQVYGAWSTVKSIKVK